MLNDLEDITVQERRSLPKIDGCEFPATWAALRQCRSSSNEKFPRSQSTITPDVAVCRNLVTHERSGVVGGVPASREHSRTPAAVISPLCSRRQWRFSSHVGVARRSMHGVLMRTAWYNTLCHAWPRCLARAQIGRSVSQLRPVILASVEQCARGMTTGSQRQIRRTTLLTDTWAPCVRQPQCVGASSVERWTQGRGWAVTGPEPKPTSPSLFSFVFLFSFFF
jgi:hypothetical protein